MQEIIEIIRKNIGNANKNYKAHKTSLASLGGKVGDIFERSKGNDYFGLSVRLLGNVKPLLTVDNILHVIGLIDKQEYMKAIKFLDLDSMETLMSVLHRWTIQVLGIKVKSYPLDKYLEDWIKTIKSDPINVKIEVVNIGQNKKTNAPVVPKDWIGRIFDNASSMHLEMDKLKTGPSTTYAVTHSLTFVKVSKIITKLPDVPHELFSTSHILDCPDTHFLCLGDNKFIGFSMDMITDKRDKTVSYKTEYGPRIEKLSSGVLSSMLQKAIRRGSVDLLCEVIPILNRKPNYVLPNMGYKNVSSSRQCTWRLFISSLEDVTYYSNGELYLLDLILLTLIIQNNETYRFSDKIIDKICILGSQLCNTNYHTPYNSIPQKGKKYCDEALIIALEHMNMMPGDRDMITKYLMLKDRFPLTKNIKNNDDIDIEDVILSSFDHHCKPSIILVYQSLVSMTTKDISTFIWDNSSSINYRKKYEEVDIQLLRNVQELYWNGFPCREEITKVDTSPETILETDILSEGDKREVFLIFFGNTFKDGNTEYIISGNKEFPIRYKARDNIWKNSRSKKILQKFTNQTIPMKGMVAPKGYSFKYKAQKYISKIVFNKGKYKFIVCAGNKEIELPLFDGSPLLKFNIPKVINDEEIEIKNDIQSIIKYRTTNSPELCRVPLNISLELAISVYTKLLNKGITRVNIGPVDRLGNRTENSIHKLLEGKIWNIFNYLSWLYPETVSLSGVLNFNINNSTAEYNLLMEDIREIIFKDNDYEKITNVSININLWEHQKRSVNKMYGAYKLGLHGMGDASSVGSGKTLIGLSLGAKMINDENIIGGGILVLVPKKILIDMWHTEINKYTSGYDVLLHTAKTKIEKSSIKRNSIVISSLNTIRDHPIRNCWLLTIIDECLSVQNNNALWTEEAWKQSLISNFVILLSATFFRSRYNNLYYMLSMLQSCIPIDKSQLNTILNERLIINRSISTRIWDTTTHYIPFPETIRPEYDHILNDYKGNLNEKLIYTKLLRLLKSERDYVATYLADLLDSENKSVIFADGKKEAEIFSEVLGLPIYNSRMDVTLYNNIIANINDVALGVNNLVHFDTLILRPPCPDLVPQIKGRLDRPGQTNNYLNIHYFMIDKSIELGLERRMNIANNFNYKYIMPLAEFYKISLSNQ